MELLKILDLHRTQDGNIWGAALVLFFGLLHKSNVLPPPPQVSPLLTLPDTCGAKI